jgi:uncharacterized low-complexity protein
MKKLILSSLIALGMMAFSVNAVASEGTSEPTHKCGEGKCGGDTNGTTSKCGTGKCGGGK